MVPVSVERHVKGKPAAVTWWVDNFLMTLRERHEKKVQPPDISRWNDQRFQGWMFNQLIYNTDPNLGNFVISTGWKLWMIDFTRAFRTFRELYNVKKLSRIDRRLYESLQRLNAESLEAATAPYLDRRERKAILARRDLLLKHYDGLIAERGEEVVICRWSEH